MRSGKLHSRRRERGSALILVVIAAAALIGIAGMALDASRLGYMKARLQSVVDAMALAAAKRLDETGSPDAACEAARQSLIANAQGFKELAEALPSPPTCGDIDIRYSSVIPFDTTQAGAARYVRVAIDDMATGASLAQALGFTTLEVSASAIAGPSAPLAEVCSVLPIAVCEEGSKPYFGFEPRRVYALQKNDKKSGGSDPNDALINFHLLELEGPGARLLREALAGGYDKCLTVGEKEPIKEGENVGPFEEGINTRFNIRSSNLPLSNYPPDVLWRGTDPPISVAANGTLRQGSKPLVWGSDVTLPNRDFYVDRLKNGGPYDSPPRPEGDGVFLRREVAVPVGDCKKIDNGEIPLIGTVCFFLLQKVGKGEKNSQLFGEFLQDCAAAGTPGPNPGTGGPYVIQLFRDPSSSDS
jgi:hypothetical protein